MYSTREERIVFERAVDKIHPDLVILVICGNDALPVGDPETMKQLPIPDLDGCLNEVQQLVDDCRERNISFAFTLYRIEPASMFIRTMMRRFEEYATKNKIPYVELGSILLSKFRTSQLVVHRTDPHPNEIAHRLAAEALAELVIENELLQRHE